MTIMVFCPEDVQIMRMEIAYLESALIDARNDIAKLKEENSKLRKELEYREDLLVGVTWDLLATKADLERATKAETT